MGSGGHNVLKVNTQCLEVTAYLVLLFLVSFTGDILYQQL